VSLSQAELKRLRQLSLKKFREESGRYLVQGRKVVTELLQSSGTIERIVASSEAAAWVAPLAQARAVPVDVLPDAELDRIGTFEKGNALIAIAVTPPSPDFRAPAAGEFMLALDGVRDPRNMGGLLRIADWFGVKRVICSHDCMEVFNPKCVQSTMGSLFHVEVRRVPDLAAELVQLRQAGAQIYIADMDGAPAFSTALALPSVLVLGSESHGHSASVAALQAEVISIPRIGHAESLNVAMAASALCMELTRQRISR
jgi:TrmH family RNA methyltransferase